MAAVWNGTGAMHTGHKVSAVLHVGLILWVMLFDLFSAPDRELRTMVTDVALISAEDFAALSRPRPPAPEPEPAPEPARQPPAARPEPAPVSPPPPVAAPQPAPITPPPPLAQPSPQPAPTPPAPEPARPQAAVISDQPSPPDAALRPVQRAAERVAPEAAPPPDPEARTGRRDLAAVQPDPAATPAEAQPAQEATQRAAAATETVTEATRLSETEAPRRTATAPEVSLRPQPRPQRPAEPVRTAVPAPEAPRPAPQPAQQPTPQPAAEPAPVGPSADAIADALAEALAASLAEPAAPQLSQADMDMLRLRVNECWNVGALGTDAMQAIVTIGFEMTRDARPIPGSYRLVAAEGGTPSGQQIAFQAGLAAIEDCGANGFGLPQNLYDLWRQVEITFNPARMSIR